MSFFLFWSLRSLQVFVWPDFSYLIPGLSRVKLNTRAVSFLSRIFTDERSSDTRWLFSEKPLSTSLFSYDNDSKHFTRLFNTTYCGVCCSINSQSLLLFHFYVNFILNSSVSIHFTMSWLLFEFLIFFTCVLCTFLILQHRPLRPVLL